MKVDLLRQLDEWGNHYEATIDHVDIEEVLRNVPETTETRPRPAAPSPRPWWRIPARYAGVTAVVLAVLFAGVGLIARGPISREFSSVGGFLGARDSSRAVEAVPTTRPPATTQAPAATAAPTTAAPTTTSPPPSTTVAPSVTTPPTSGGPSALGRDVIFTGDLAIDATDVAAAVTSARAIVESSGGYVFGQELGGKSTVMSLKIPAEFFQDTVDRLSELGTVRNARISSQDVTERIVDLESRIRTAEVSVERLQGLLGEAGNINSIARLESELLSRETQLETLRGQLRTLQDQVALSTIVLTVREFVPTPTMTTAVTVHNVGTGDGEECFTGPAVRFAPGDEVVICVDIINTGNLPLTDIEIVGPDALLAGLAPVQSAGLSTLPAGERYVQWTTTTAADSLDERITVRAVPIGENGERMIDQLVESRRSLTLTVQTAEEPEPEGLPSLGDALSAGWDVLSTGANALAVAVAFFLPFIWIPMLVGVLMWWRRRRA